MSPAQSLFSTSFHASTDWHAGRAPKEKAVYLKSFQKAYFILDLYRAAVHARAHFQLAKGTLGTLFNLLTALIYFTSNSVRKCASSSSSSLARNYLHKSGLNLLPYCVFPSLVQLVLSV